jgi:hypothetical protein
MKLSNLGDFLSHKKIIPYDEETAETIAAMQSCGQLMIPRDNFAPIERHQSFPGSRYHHSDAGLWG